MGLSIHRDLLTRNDKEALNMKVWLAIYKIVKKIRLDYDSLAFFPNSK